MFELGMPWWELVLRATLVYAVLLLLVRMGGKRAIAQVTPFDLILLILLGTAVQNSLVGRDTSLLGGLILAATLIVLNQAVAWAASRTRRAHALLEGEPVMLARNGEVFAARLRKESISPADFDEAMRRHGIDRREQIACAWLETDGEITLITRTQEAT